MMLPELPIEKRYDETYISALTEQEFENLGCNSKCAIFRYFPEQWERLTQEVFEKYSGKETICDMVALEFDFIRFMASHPRFNN